MRELSVNESYSINGGGLTIVEALTYACSLVLSGPAWPVAVATIIIVEYADYKDGV